MTAAHSRCPPDPILANDTVLSIPDRLLSRDTRRRGTARCTTRVEPGLSRNNTLAVVPTRNVWRQPGHPRSKADFPSDMWNGRARAPAPTARTLRGFEVGESLHRDLPTTCRSPLGDAVPATTTVLRLSGQLINPKFEASNRPMLGKTIGRSAAATPYHDASVAAYCSTEAVGIHRPLLSVSLGPLS
jgi:hypothetical protein